MVFKKSIVLMILVFCSSCANVTKYVPEEFVWNQTWDTYSNDQKLFRTEEDIKLEMEELEKAIKFLERVLEEIERLEIKSKQNMA